MPMALMKPRKKGRERTPSRKPRRQRPAVRMKAPARPVTIPATWACLRSSCSMCVPLLIASLTTEPVSRLPAASGPTTICGQVPSSA